VKDKTPGKSQNLFIFLSLIISLSFSLIIAEWVLRYQRQSIEHEINTSERMEPGMILYDAQLGWKLKPYWSGKHHHYDYDVTYDIDRDGFRESGIRRENVDYAVVGDSFSFGLGVNDDQTFTALLNANGEEKNIFRNYSVPGYSTDQQLLLLDRLKDKVDTDVLLVVYLGNDIFDNTRGYPLQAEHAKPYFKLTNNKLSLENTPVPLSPKSAAARKNTISNIVLGEPHHAETFSDWLARSEINRRLGLFQKNVELSYEEMDQRFSEPLKLFNALVYEIQRLTDKNARKLNVVLLPGRSYVEQPISVSAQYQEYFRQKIRSSLDASSIKVMDLAAHLRALHDKGIQKLYYPNEGHLTPLGHQCVADYLAVQIKNIKPNP
jgi:lysophospholipase L1-like esterase